MLTETTSHAYDADGTIIDSMPLQAEAWHDAVRSVAGNDSAIWQQIHTNLFSGKAGEQMFDGVSVDADAKKLMREFKDARWHSIRADAPLLPDCARVLREVQKGRQLAIATTADRDYVTAVLQRHAIERVFWLIVTNADVPNPKPSPDMLRQIAKRGRFDVAKMVMFGDAISDAKMAEAAGCAFVHIATATAPDMDAYRPVHTVANWTELGNIFGV